LILASVMFFLFPARLPCDAVHVGRFVEQINSSRLCVLIVLPEYRVRTDVKSGGASMKASIVISLTSFACSENGAAAQIRIRSLAIVFIDVSICDDYCLTNGSV
jgi:hypothetical protein